MPPTPPTPPPSPTPQTFPKKLGYLIPEFPGQTHIWMWREITHLREWGVPIRMFSTTPPTDRDRARHAWAADAAAEATYLGTDKAACAAALAWAAASRPAGLASATKLASTFGLDQPKAKTLALLGPAALLVRECARDGITHVHGHTFANGAVLLALAGRIAGDDLSFSLTLNADLEWWGGGLREKLHEAEFTIAITEWLLAQVNRDYPDLKPGQALLGRIGVDTRKWTPEPPAAEDGGLRVMTVGRLHASKGHDDLIRAVGEVEGATLKLAGDGPQRAELEALVAELGLGDRVTFLGSIGEDELVRELRDAHVFAGASHREPLGVVFMEAMSLGLPTVATNGGGVPEIIDDGETGVLVPPKDPAALAEALRSLAADPDRRRRLGEAGRASIVERFDSRIGAATVYERIAGVAPPRDA